jgi:hypothetical protein
VRRIVLSDITDVKVGVNSTATLRGNSLGVINDGLFFSLITGNRTLDLKANEVKTRNKWVQYFYDRVLGHARSKQRRGNYALIDVDSDER